MSDARWDVFVSHASEDKETVAAPLVQALVDAGLRVWYDRIELSLGDSLRGRIDEGLAHSRFGIVVLSPAFFDKHWPKQELNGLAQREVDGEKVILPIWYDITAEQVRKFSPMLADRVAAQWSEGLDAVVAQILAVVRGDAAHKDKPYSVKEPARDWEMELELKFVGLVNSFRKHGGNTWTPPFGSQDERDAKEMVARGWLSAQYGGGYRVASIFPPRFGVEIQLRVQGLALQKLIEELKYNYRRIEELSHATAPSLVTSARQGAELIELLLPSDVQQFLDAVYGKSENAQRIHDSIRDATGDVMPELLQIEQLLLDAKKELPALLDKLKAFGGTK